MPISSITANINSLRGDDLSGGIFVSELARHGDNDEPNEKLEINEMKLMYYNISHMATQSMYVALKTLSNYR